MDNSSTPALPLPQLSVPWIEAGIILDGGTAHSDFTLFQDPGGRWHVVGIAGQNMPDDTMFHAVSDDLFKPFTYIDRVGSDDTGAMHMWAPYCLYDDNDTALMYYCHTLKDGSTTMRLLASTAPAADHFVPYKESALPNNILFKEVGDRDPCIFWDEKLQKYLMYYATDPDGIRCRTSTDLLHWSDPVSVMGTPPGYTLPESPTVVERFGYYYLFVSGFDYGRVSVYASKDPFHFGDAAKDRLEEISGHAVEIVSVNGQDYIAAAAVASKFGNPPGYHDLQGVYLQKLEWVIPDQP